MIIPMTRNIITIASIPPNIKPGSERFATFKKWRHIPWSELENRLLVGQFGFVYSETILKKNFGAPRRNRTDMMLPSRDFESRASTSSARGYDYCLPKM